MAAELDPQGMAAAALRSARSQGCTCDPDIVIQELVPSIFDAAVAHDDDCPLIRRVKSPDN